jgi:hypothetical protein
VLVTNYLKVPFRIDKIPVKGPKRNMSSVQTLNKKVGHFRPIRIVINKLIVNVKREVEGSSPLSLVVTLLLSLTPLHCVLMLASCSLYGYLASKVLLAVQCKIQVFRAIWHSKTPLESSAG